MSDVADNESSSSEATDDKNFIDKLLVEMKSKFNKTDKKQLSVAMENEITDDDVSEVAENSKDDCKEKLINTQTKELPFITEEMLNEELKLQQQINENADGNNEIEEEEKPRIVLTFRKPASETVSPKSNPKNPNKPNLSRRSTRRKSNIAEEKHAEIGLKRSARRRSKDCGESILQSAIARKEKSYNESSKPQRLTRQLKATPKILENLKNAALEKNKCDKKKVLKLNDKQKRINMNSSDVFYNNTDEGTTQHESDFGDIDSSCKKHKHKHHHTIKHLKRNTKRLKSTHSESSKESDSDQSVVTEIKEPELNSNHDLNKVGTKSSKIHCTAEDKPFRRSQRISSSRYKTEDFEVIDVEVDISEPSIAETSYQMDPELSSVGAQLIASRLCLCTRKSHLYFAAEQETTFCSAVDSINKKLIGCNNLVDVNEVSMMRPSSRVPYILLCKLHQNRLLRHNCCPTCGIFCTQGQFAQCEAKHQYHRDCQISVGDVDCCPHCGQSTPDCDIYITMLTEKQPIFLPKQNVAAKMSFPLKVTTDQTPTKPSVSPPLISPNLIQFSSTDKNYNLNNCKVADILQIINEGDQEKLRAIIGSHFTLINAPLDECDGGTLMHYCAQNGFLAAVHMFVSAKMDLNSLDKEQNTPLMLAVLSMKNDVVKYLVKSGAIISIKGTDGMTALHLAAKCGNLVACELLISSSLHTNQYINMPDDGGWTPLVWACEHGHGNISKFLVCKGADPMLRDVEHNIALHWATFSGSSQIIELLLNKGSDVNAINAHGDTPLHIAARQNNYNSVIILLARGADIEIVNKVDETALDCCQETGDCHTAILLNVHMKTLIKLNNKSNQFVLSNDISNGKESNPIQCVNMVDNEPMPKDYIYITKNCITDDVTIDLRITSLTCCKCEEKCDSELCVCTNNSVRCWYDFEGKLTSEFDYVDPPMLFECNMLCSCNAITCINRVVQRGLSQRFQLFRTKNKGWGIRTLQAIPKGSFVCEYVGEILTDAEANAREDDNFLFDLDSKVEMQDKELFCIDAKVYGNFSRFINHSCEPNLLPIRVFIEHQDLRFPRIAFFAKQGICANEELSFDYGEKFWKVKYKSFTCSCKKVSCKYSEEAILASFKNCEKEIEEPNENAH